MLYPVPFIVDTSAPAPVYLGPKAFVLLDNIKLIRDVHGRDHPFQVKGIMDFNGKTIEDPWVQTVPMDKLQGEVRMDPRANILGLPVIKILGILKWE